MKVERTFHVNFILIYGNTLTLVNQLWYLPTVADFILKNTCN